MFVEAKFFHKAGVGSGGGSDPHNLGYYVDLTALQTAHPTGTDGDFAILGSTDTIWVWDSGTSAWKDTDTKGQVTSVNGQTGAVTVSEVPSQTGQSGKFLTTDGTNASWDNVVTTPLATPVLAVADWSLNTQTITVTGVTATNTVFVAPAPASAADYATAGILCTAQATDSLTFTCTTVPTNTITLSVVILG